MESGNCDSSSSSTTPYSSFLPPPYGATGPGRPQAFGAQQPCFYLDKPHFSQQQDINNMTDSSVPSQQQTQQQIPPLLETGTAFSTLLKIIQQQQQNGNNYNFSGFPLPYVPAPTTMGFGATSQQQISPRAQFVLSQNTSMPPTGVVNGIVPLTPSVSVSMTAPPTQPSSPSPSVPLQPGFGYSFDGNIYQNSGPTTAQFQRRSSPASSPLNSFTSPLTPVAQPSPLLSGSRHSPPNLSLQQFSTVMQGAQQAQQASFVQHSMPFLQTFINPQQQFVGNAGTQPTPSCNLSPLQAPKSPVWPPYHGRTIPEQQQAYAEQIQLLQQQQAQLQQLQQQLQLQQQQFQTSPTTPLHLLTQSMLGNSKLGVCQPQPLMRNFISMPPQQPRSSSPTLQRNFVQPTSISPNGGRHQTSPSPSPTLARFRQSPSPTLARNFAQSPVQSQPMLSIVPPPRASPSPSGSRHMQPSPNTAPRHTVMMPYYTGAGYPTADQQMVSPPVSPVFLHVPEQPVPPQPEGSFAPYLTMSTQRVLKFKAFTIQLHLNGAWPIKYTESEILRAGLSAKCRREIDLAENVSRCFCSGKRRIIETGISSKEAFGPELQAGLFLLENLGNFIDGSEVYNFDMCKSNCSSSRDHHKSRIVVVFDELPNTKPIFSLPFVLLARDKRSNKESSVPSPSSGQQTSHSPNYNQDSANTSPASSPIGPAPVVATAGEMPPKRLSTDIDMMIELESMLLHADVPPAMQNIPAQTTPQTTPQTGLQMQIKQEENDIY